MKENKPKRPLQLKTPDAITQEATGLLDSGYKSSGRWNLAQTCFHLSEWTRFPMDGFPRPPFLLRGIFGTLKALGITDRMKRSILENGFKPGTPTAPQTAINATKMSDAEGVEKLKEVVERMKSFAGPLHPSPIFGAMDANLYVKVSLLHAEHHFAFLWPIDNADRTLDAVEN